MEYQHKGVHVKIKNQSLVIVTMLASLLTTTMLTAVLTAQSGGTVESFYDLKTTKLDGTPADLGEHRGKVALVVNVASKCGFTPQYTGLEQLWRDMKDKGVVVLGFPSNDFGGQEPGTAEDIATFCKTTYDVTFPLFSKLQTKAGQGQSPIYAWLGESGDLPAWNFTKYVINKDGQVVAFFPSKVAPEAPELKAAIDKALSGS